MTKNERLLALARGAPAGPVLFYPILMHFAARFCGKTYAEFASDYRVLVETNVRCLERFDHDAVSTISDPFRETAAFGAEIAFPGDQVPQCRASIVRTMDDVEALDNADVYAAQRTLDRIRATRYYRELLDDSVPIIGWIEGPLAEACDLAGVNEVLLKLAMEPDFVRRLMSKCMITAKDFARAQIRAGSGVMGVGDAICSQISAGMYRRYVLPLHHELFEFIHSLGALVKLHICGDITHLLPDLGRAGADIVDLDWMVSFDSARGALGPKVMLCGNLDPVSVIQGLPAEQVSARCRSLIQQERDGRFILSGGCEITASTPRHNLRAMKTATTGTGYVGA